MALKKLTLKCEGIDMTYVPVGDEIFEKGVTYSLMQDDFEAVEKYEPGSIVELLVYLWHKECSLEDIRFVDSAGRPFTPNGLSEIDFNRDYKDLYWYYNRNENHAKVLKFEMPENDVEVVAEYKKSDSIGVVQTDFSAIKDILAKDEHHAPLSYLYSYEETANDTHHYFMESDVYFYEVESSLTFCFATTKKRNFHLEINGKRYNGHSQSTENVSGDKIYLTYFGSLSKMMDDDIMGDGKCLLTHELYTLAKVVLDN